VAGDWPRRINAHRRGEIATPARISLMMMIVTVATVRADFAEASVKRDLLPMTRDALCASSVAPKHLHQLMRFLAPVQSARRIMFFFLQRLTRDPTFSGIPVWMWSIGLRG